ncbi:hypothetical protein PHYBOEH_008775 [Phytophthora boehmeriae]|uniref:Uncharacterized protein n=1 Tax=Phytophthora boehmeriae TaxID=109152 RepID=A0A8T1VY16_9STRA|nr:hypothetical protein PHYBOEH_008775 [Phytophthora boehmeriae]
MTANIETSDIEDLLKSFEYEIPHSELPAIFEQGADAAFYRVARSRPTTLLFLTLLSAFSMADKLSHGSLPFIRLSTLKEYFRSNTDGNARRNFNVVDQFQYFIDCSDSLPMQRPMKSYHAHRLKREAFVPLWVVASNDRLRKAVEAKLARSGPIVPVSPFLYPDAMSDSDLLSSCIYYLSLGLLGQVTDMFISYPAPNVPGHEEYFVRNYGAAEVYLDRRNEMMDWGAKGFKLHSEAPKMAFVTPVPKEDVELCEEWLRNLFTRLNYIMLWLKNG